MILLFQIVFYYFSAVKYSEQSLFHSCLERSDNNLLQEVGQCQTPCSVALHMLRCSPVRYVLHQGDFQHLICTLQWRSASCTTSRINHLTVETLLHFSHQNQKEFILNHARLISLMFYHDSDKRGGEEEFDTSYVNKQTLLYDQVTAWNWMKLMELSEQTFCDRSARHILTHSIRRAFVLQAARASRPHISCMC